MLVLKFGGTSVGSAQAIKATAKAISRNIASGAVCVLSAMSGITDLNLQIMRLSRNRDNQSQVEELFIELENRHLSVCSELFGDKELFSETKLAILSIIDEFRTLARGVQLLTECTPKSLDAGASFGERLSTLIVSNYLNSIGVKSTQLDSREFIKTDSNFVSANVDFPLSNKLINEIVKPLISANSVLIAQGFIGSDTNGAATTLGRGGSDYSAALLGSALNVEKILIFSDVDGVLSADPRIVKNVKVIEYINAEQMRELAQFGAKVLHPASLYPALEKNIPVRSLNTFNLDSKGTLIGAEPTCGETKIESISLLKEVFLIKDRISKRKATELKEIAKSSLIFTKSQNDFVAIIKENNLSIEIPFSPLSLICISGANIQNNHIEIFSALKKIDAIAIFCGFSDTSFLIAVERATAIDNVIFLHKVLIESL